MRLTADGALAVHHDAEIPGCRRGGRARRWPTCRRTCPLLADVLAVCEGMVVNVEIKNAPQDPGWDPGEAVAALTAAAIEEAGWTERVVVSSFQVATLRAVQAADGRLALGSLWGFAAEPEPALAEAAGARGSGPSIPSSRSVDRELVERGPRNGACRQRVDGQRPRGPAGHGGAGGRHGDHGSARRGPGRCRGDGAASSDPEAGAAAEKRACHRAEWRGTARVHKDGRP